jgi:hypothetical protein
MQLEAAVRKRKKRKRTRIRLMVELSVPDAAGPKY